MPAAGRSWSVPRDAFKALVEDNRVWFGANGNAMPRRKRFLTEVNEGIVPTTWWSSDVFGDNQTAKKEIRSIFSDVDNIFQTPKPAVLIERFVQLATRNNSIILDSFAGSGTTAHAVLKLNAADGGNRKFILIEQEDYAETITAERVRRVINGYGEGTKAVAGLGGSFDYYTIGEPLFLDDGNLNEDIGIEEIRKYIAFSENITSRITSRTAGVPPASRDADDPSPIRRQYLLAEQNGMSYYFYYERDRSTTLDIDFLSRRETRSKRMLIYADRCLLNKQQLNEFGITFKKIPRDITRF